MFASALNDIENEATASYQLKIRILLTFSGQNIDRDAVGQAPPTPDFLLDSIHVQIFRVVEFIVLPSLCCHGMMILVSVPVRKA